MDNTFQLVVCTMKPWRRHSAKHVNVAHLTVKDFRFLSWSLFTCKLFCHLIQAVLSLRAPKLDMSSQVLQTFVAPSSMYLHWLTNYSLIVSILIQILLWCHCEACFTTLRNSCPTVLASGYFCFAFVLTIALPLLIMVSSFYKCKHKILRWGENGSHCRKNWYNVVKKLIWWVGETNPSSHKEIISWHELWRWLLLRSKALFTYRRSLRGRCQWPLLFIEIQAKTYGRKRGQRPCQLE